MNLRPRFFPVPLALLALLALPALRPFALEPYDFLMDPLESAMTMQMAVSVSGTEIGSKSLTEPFKGVFQNIYTPSLGDLKSLQILHLQGSPVREKIDVEMTGEESTYYITFEGAIRDL